MTESRSTDLNPEIRRIVDAARDVWTRRLIDHSRRNSLLFYRNLKVGTLDLTAETEAAARLLAGEKLAVESLASAYLDEGDTDPVVRTRAEAEARQKARSALVALQRKALSNLEEKGIETLHLAMGMATWARRRWWATVQCSVATTAGPYRDAWSDGRRPAPRGHGRAAAEPGVALRT